MRRKSDAHNSSSSPRASSYSIDDETFASNYEDKQFFSAIYEFSQGLGPVQVWEYQYSNENLMRFVVNTPPPDLDTSSTVNNGQRVTNIISKYEDLYYIAIYSQALDCQARGFTRSIVLVVANQSFEIIKYVHEAYIDELTKIIDHIYENSYKLFLDEIQGYSLSLFKTAEATNSSQLRSKLKELKTYLPSFGIDIEKIINSEEEKQQHQQSIDQISSENESKENANEAILSQENSQLKTYGEVKDESFFTKINNNLRSVRTISDFDYSILEDLQELIVNLPKTETTAAICAHIDLGSFRDFKSYKKYQNFKKSIDLKTSSDDTLKQISFNTITKPTEPSSISSNLQLDKIKSSAQSDEKNSSESITNVNKSKHPLEITEIPYQSSNAKDNITKISTHSKSDSKTKSSHGQTIRDKDTSKKRPETTRNRKQRKKQDQLKQIQNRHYTIHYPYDFNFGGFKGQYSRLVTDILNTNYDASLFTLQWLARFKVFHYCAFTILSGGTLVIVTTIQDTEHGKMLADRFSLLAPHSLVRGRVKRTIKKASKSGNLRVDFLRDESGFDSDDSDDCDDEFEEESQIVLVKESVEPRECFRYSIVVTNSLKQPSSAITFCEPLEKVSSFPVVTTFSKANEKDESLLSVLDLTTNIYKGDGCPDASFVMKELGRDASLSLISSNTNTNGATGGGISPFSSVSAVSRIHPSQTQSNITLDRAQAGISSSSSSFSPVSKRRQKPSFKLTSNSPPSPLSFASESEGRADDLAANSPTQKPKKLASIRNYSSSIITMSGSNSNTNLSSSNKDEDNREDDQNSFNESKVNQEGKSVIVFDAENEKEIEGEISVSENESVFSSLSSRKTPGFGFGFGTFSGMRHSKRPFRPSFMSESSTISGSPSFVAESSESENLFVLNMYATINRVAARFVKKLAEFADHENQPSKEELMKEIGFTEDDEPILKYWIYCFFNKQKCRPVLFNNRSNVGFTVISMYK